MQNLQYDLFTERKALTIEESHMFRLEMQALLESSNKVRKSLFAKLGDQSKLILKLMQEVDELKNRRRSTIIPFDETDFFKKYS